jgi:hypothetical protein
MSFTVSYIVINSKRMNRNIVGYESFFGGEEQLFGSDALISDGWERALV